MAFKDKYTIKDEVDKIKISPDAYAVGEEIDILVQKIQEILRRL